MKHRKSKINFEQVAMATIGGLAGLAVCEFAKDAVNKALASQTDGIGKTLKDLAPALVSAGVAIAAPLTLRNLRGIDPALVIGITAASGAKAVGEASNYVIGDTLKNALGLQGDALEIPVHSARELRAVVGALTNERRQLNGSNNNPLAGSNSDPLGGSLYPNEYGAYALSHGVN